MGVTKKALIIGATGLVGKTLLAQLEASPDYRSIISISRSQLSTKSKKTTHILTDFHHLDSYENAFAVDDIFCCIGTTLKEIKSLDLYKIIELYFPKTIARLGKQNNAKSIAIISCIGANPESPNYYLSIKGKLEEIIQAFDFESTHIYRPSLITGKRKTTRFKELLVHPFCSLCRFIPFLSQFAPVSASQLAKAMLFNTLLDKKGTFYYTRDSILNHKEN
tara:strand:- start:88 stop:750 length:663 start_codon:yes stop_codon:yes gene_type:complete